MKTKLLFLLFLVSLLSVSQAVGQTITITQSSSGITIENNYSSGAERTWAQDGIGFGGKAITKRQLQAILQTQANNGVLYNTSEMPGKILSVTVNYQSGETARATTLYVGEDADGRLVNSVNANYSIAGTAENLGSQSGTYTWNVSSLSTNDNRFFALKRGGNAGYWSSIVITYEAGIETDRNGAWNNPTTWVGGIVPTSSDNAIINHNVTNVNAGVYLASNITRNTGTTTTVNSGASLSTGAFVYANNGTTTVDGTFVLQANGSVTGNNLQYGSSSTLNINHSNSTTLVVGSTQRFWPVANPPFNVTVSTNSPVQLNTTVGSVAGMLLLNSSMNTSVANVRVNGVLRINANGLVTGNAPIYGNASVLRYYSGGIYGRGTEWSSAGIGTIGVTPGYPNIVEIQNSTILDFVNGASPIGDKAMAGNLTIANGSALDMSTAASAGGALIVAGNVALSGTASLILGLGTNDDLKIGGNFNVPATATFTGNNKKVIFTNNSHTITAPSITIPYLVFEPVSGGSTVTLANNTNVVVSAPLGGNAITFNSAIDIFAITGNNIGLTIGSSGIANTIIGGGTFRGSVTSSLTLLGNGSLGTLAFSGSAAQQTLGTFTVNRTSGSVACVMGSDVTIATALNLTAGIVDLDNRTMTINNAATVSGANSSNYIIADDAFGGVLRRQFSALGSFVFPIGDKTGVMEYSPTILNLTSGTGMSATSYIGVSVNDSKHLEMDAPTHFISRYWTVNRTGTITNPIYNFSGTYLPADVNGTETTSLSQQWNGTVWSYTGAVLTGNTLTYANSTHLPTTTGINHFSGGWRNPEINIRQATTNYLSGSTYNFGTVTTGSSNSVTFTIENLGNSDLILNANPIILGSGFTLTSPVFNSNISVGSMGSITVTIQFLPTVAGPYSGGITFGNNDTDEGSYVISFTGNGSGSSLSDILRVTNSEPTTISSLVTGTISTITDGVEVWRFNLRDGGVSGDADSLPTIMTAFTVTRNSNDAIGDWSETIENIVLVDVASNTLLAYGTVTPTQIQFTGLNVVATDDTSVLLALRMTLKCPVGVDALDGDDFGFTISNANVIFDPSGSGKFSFSAQSTVNGRLALAVVATELHFTTQPITTGVGNVMGNVVVTATDACGNIDRNFTTPISLSSSGTMNPVTPVNAVNGVAVFSGITHTVDEDDVQLTATAGSLTEVSTLFDISTITVLLPGDLAVLAVNTNVGGGSNSTDQIVFVCFRDLLPGTSLFLTDNGYERRYANQWGGTEGVITITRTGSILPKGTIITIESTIIGGNVTSGSHYDVYTCGTIDTDWTKTALSGGSIGGFNLNDDDDIYFMQGGVWNNSTSHNSTYTGNVLYAWTESGWDAAPGGSSQDAKWSTLYPGMECFSTVAPVGDGKVKFSDPIKPDFSTTTNSKFDWIALINDQGNWVSYPGNPSYNSGGYDYKNTCDDLHLDTDIYVNGRWSGRRDNNWFNCENWDTLLVPDENVDVQIGSSSFIPHPIVDATAPFAIYQNYIAKSRNLTITDKKLEVVGNPNNILEIHGNLTISNTVADATLDMNDGNPTTDDGQIYLYGNWTNNKNNDAFDEGNGTVHFIGSSTQVINNILPLGTESFYNVVIDNDFDTAISNDLYSKGNVTVATNRDVTVDSAGYLRIENRLTNNGNITIESSGQLVQVNDTDTNNGNYTGTRFTVRRNYTAKDIDYVYWSAPTQGFNYTNLPTGYRYVWNPTFLNANGTQGNWVVPNPPVVPSAGMVAGKGYIARTFNGSATATTLPLGFIGKPNNGLINISVSRGSYTGIPYDAEPSNPDNLNTTQWDDNWNLIGNPYPSPLNVEQFLLKNSNLEGFVNIWTHNGVPTSAIDPFYYNFGYNYDTADYITHNGTATTSGPLGFNGNIASGQGFFVLMQDGVATTESIMFDNSMRRDVVGDAIYNNSQFYRMSQSSVNEKHRIWLDVVSSQGNSNRMVVGYVTNATNDKDRLYDAVTKPTGLSLYSFTDDLKGQEFCIQGRALPFINSDKVKLGFKSMSDGSYSIAIAAIDGLFENQDIYLEDKDKNIIHDLKQNPYHFTSSKGVFNDRFVLRYTTEALDNSDFELLNEDVRVVTNDNLVLVKSEKENLKAITIYDILGRKLFEVDNVGNQEYFISNITNSNQALIVRIKLENGYTVIKKISI